MIPKYRVIVRMKDGGVLVVENGLVPKETQLTGVLLVVKDIDDVTDYLIPWDEFRLVEITRIREED